MHDGLFGFLGYIHSLYISEVRDYEMRDKTNVWKVPFQNTLQEAT